MVKIAGFFILSTPIILPYQFFISMFFAFCYGLKKEVKRSNSRTINKHSIRLALAPLIIKSDSVVIRVSSMPYIVQNASQRLAVFRFVHGSKIAGFILRASSFYLFFVA